MIRDERRYPWLWLLASVIVCLAVWYWAARILLPANTVAAAAQGRPVGNNSDLYPRWVGTRELLLHKRDPYSSEVTAKIQQGYYGRTLSRANPGDPTDESSFAYPLYVVFLVAPFATLPFPQVMKVSGWLLLACAGWTVPLWMTIAGLRPKWTALSGLLLTVATYPVVMIFYKQQLTALAVLLIAGAAVSARRDWLALSGLLLALATIKPQLAGLFVLWFLLWSVSQWRQRRRWILSFVVSMGLLAGGAQLLSPGWMVRFLYAARDYQRYAADPSLLQVVFTRWGGIAVAVCLLIWLIAICWRRRTAEAESSDFAWALAATATVTLVILPKLAPYNQLLLIPAFTKILSLENDFSRRARVVLRAACACQAWQWLAALAISLVSLFIGTERLQAVAAAPLYTLYAIPLLALAALLLTLPRKVSRPQLTSEVPAAQRE